VLLILIVIHPGSNNSKEEGEKVVVFPSFCSHEFHKVENQILNTNRKKFEPIEKYL
jgi:hypothetical protein